VSISSGSAYGRENRAAYCAAKAGVIGLTRAMSLDHRREKVRVNCLVPSFTLSGMTENSPSETLAAQAEKSVAGRVATPEDVAAATLFLCSDAAVTITGAVLEMG
jgi:NAD(P)-dependent dehydrogenase (short-subunit alcohol dehydrogenase family)